MFDAISAEKTPLFSLLICVEDTANRGGGTPHPLDTLHSLSNLAHEKGARAHLDGARIQCRASHPHCRRRTDIKLDTVSFCLSKGLGGPSRVLVGGPKRSDSSSQMDTKSPGRRNAAGGRDRCGRYLPRKTISARKTTIYAPKGCERSSISRDSTPLRPPI